MSGCSEAATPDAGLRVSNFCSLPAWQGTQCAADTVHSRSCSLPPPACSRQASMEQPCYNIACCFNSQLPMLRLWSRLPPTEGCPGRAPSLPCQAAQTGPPPSHHRYRQLAIPPATGSQWQPFSAAVSDFQKITSISGTMFHAPVEHCCPASVQQPS